MTEGLGFAADLVRSLDTLRDDAVHPAARTLAAMMRIILLASPDEPDRIRQAANAVAGDIEDVVEAAAQHPAETTAIYATSPQSVLIYLQTACGIDLGIEMAGWKPARNQLDSGSTQSRSAFLHSLAGSLYVNAITSPSAA